MTKANYQHCDLNGTWLLTDQDPLNIIKIKIAYWERLLKTQKFSHAYFKKQIRLLNVRKKELEK